MKQVRCAIYTRKSNDEGLEQDFNSLDAQREACAAYVLSQASEGWKLVSEQYDDGGISGGTLERPALQRLLADVKDGRIDIIVVYKVDRLTRSLLDFAKLVETFDAAEASFVSVTQSFNTTTSMGRLTLNMLLSFAQFEREVTAERIRDKIAASKAKGMWMGGTPPLGYQPDGRSLTIVEDHAAIVRDIFARYRALGNVRLVQDALARDGIRSPRRSRLASGKMYGGCPFSRGQLYAILRNPVYAGDIAHKDKIYSGNHPAIIERQLWEAVQRQLASHVQGVRRARERNASLLAGLLFDAAGEPLIAVHTSKSRANNHQTDANTQASTHGAKQRYRYYVSKAQHHGAGNASAKALRMPAREIEQAVLKELVALLADPMALLESCGANYTPGMLEAITARCAKLAAEVELGGSTPLPHLVERIVVHAGKLEITLARSALAELLGLGKPAELEALLPIRRDVPLRFARAGSTLRLIQEGGAPATSAPDPRLIQLLIKARGWWAELAKGELNVASLSRREGVSDSYVTRVVRLAFLAPSVVDAVLAGTIRPNFDAKTLLAANAIPASWEEQTAKFLPREP